MTVGCLSHSLHKIKIVQFTIDGKLHYSSTGTDGRPIIPKKTSVTGRHNGPVLLQKG
jgi:hypothetical protein